MFQDHLVFHSRRRQKSLAKPGEVMGQGLFSGEKVHLRCVPKEADFGIVFSRKDQGGAFIRASASNLVGTPRCTILGHQGINVVCVEHLLSALKAFEIDNALIEIEGGEIPIGDGSALPFVEMIQKAGVVELEETIDLWGIKEPIHWSEGDSQIIALPSDRLRVSCQLSYPGHPLLHSQFYSLYLDTDAYVKEIAPCRTFATYEEAVELMSKGLLKGGSLGTGVLIKGTQIINNEGLRFKDEMCRHKILDFIGDLSLMDTMFVAHYIAIRGGHRAHLEFAKKHGLIKGEVLL